MRMIIKIIKMLIYNYNNFLKINQRIKENIIIYILIV